LENQQGFETGTTMKAALIGMSILSGIISAVFWWIASTIYKKPMESFQHITTERETFPYLERVGWWNKWAAVASAISVLCGALSNAF
jgi:hypothetical protein